MECTVAFNEENTEIVLLSQGFKTGAVAISLASGHFDRVSYCDEEGLRTANDDSREQSDQEWEFDHAGKLFIELPSVPQGLDGLGGSSPTSSPTCKSVETKFSLVLDIIYNSHFESLKEDLEAAGINCTVESPDIVEHLTKVTKGRQTRKSFCQGKRNKDEIVLVYPFPGYRESALNKRFVEDLTEEFALLGDENEIRSHHQLEDTTSQPRQRSHYVVVRVRDVDRLNGRRWLNDTLVDLYMQWYVI